MCGLAAIFSYHPSAAPVDQAELLRIREAMLKRGPDGAGLWVSADKRIGLAHRRLAIIDFSEAGAQPMGTSDGSLSIVFNGEIDTTPEPAGYTATPNEASSVMLKWKFRATRCDSRRNRIRKIPA